MKWDNLSKFLTHSKCSINGTIIIAFHWWVWVFLSKTNLPVFQYFWKTKYRRKWQRISSPWVLCVKWNWQSRNQISAMWLWAHCLRSPSSFSHVKKRLGCTRIEGNKACNKGWEPSPDMQLWKRIIRKIKTFFL